MTLPPARYIVLRHEGAWKINLDNRYYGPFATQEAAVQMATETAQKASEGGYPTFVLLMNGAEFKTLWTGPAQPN